MDAMAELEVDRWLMVYSRLLDIERHWTEQIQNQQQRIQTILTVNGILLGFLAAAGFSEIVQRGALTGGLFVASLITLTVALGVGIFALWPGTPISSRSLWLDPKAAKRLAEQSSTGKAVREMCQSVVDSQASADHPGILQLRRSLMHAQLILVLLGLVLLLAALVAFQSAPQRS
jgi:hypothetical protein